MLALPYIRFLPVIQRYMWIYLSFLSGHRSKRVRKLQLFGRPDKFGSSSRSPTRLAAPLTA